MSSLSGSALFAKSAFHFLTFFKSFEIFFSTLVKMRHLHCVEGKVH